MVVRESSRAVREWSIVDGVGDPLDVDLLSSRGVTVDLVVLRMARQFRRVVVVLSRQGKFLLWTTILVETWMNRTFVVLCPRGHTLTRSNT